MHNSGLHFSFLVHIQSFIWVHFLVAGGKEWKSNSLSLRFNLSPLGGWFSRAIMWEEHHTIWVELLALQIYLTRVS